MGIGDARECPWAECGAHSSLELGETQDRVIGRLLADAEWNEDFYQPADVISLCDVRTDIVDRWV